MAASSSNATYRSPPTPKTYSWSLARATKVRRRNSKPASRSPARRSSRTTPTSSRSWSQPTPLQPPSACRCATNTPPRVSPLWPALPARRPRAGSPRSRPRSPSAPPRTPTSSTTSACRSTTRGNAPCAPATFSSSRMARRSSSPSTAMSGWPADSRMAPPRSPGAASPPACTSR